MKSQHPQAQLAEELSDDDGRGRTRPGKGFAEIIRQQKNEIILYSSNGEKVLGRFPFGAGKKFKNKNAARRAAHKREGQIQFFKHQENDEMKTNLITNVTTSVAEAYPNEHAFRMTNPGKYVRIRRQNNKFASGIHAIFGVFNKGGKATTELQAIRFDAEKFSYADAKAWIKEHDFKPIESSKATGKSAESAPETIEHDSVPETPRADGEAAVADQGHLGEQDLPVSPSFGATTFADLDALENTQDTIAEVSKRVWQFQSIVMNIVNDETIDDKVAAIKAAASEFLALVEELMGNPTEPPAEAAAPQAPTLQEVTEELRESASDNLDGIAGQAVEIVEAGDVATGGTKPLVLRVVPIKPGWGNKKDNHYYPSDILLRDAPRAFSQIKMYETDHRDNEKSNRTWVSTSMETDGQTDYGAPITRVGVHDPYFAQKVINLDRLKLLHLLECSISGNGTIRPGDFEKDGRKGKYVESLDPMNSIDWVTRAGAGGHTLNIMESEGGNVSEPINATPAVIPAVTTPAVTPPAPPVQEAQTTPPLSLPVAEIENTSAFLAEADVKKSLDATNLPQSAKDWLAESQYKNEKELKEAVARATDRVKTMTGSGQPFALGASTAPAQTRISEADYQKKLNDIDARYGVLGG